MSYGRTQLFAGHSSLDEAKAELARLESLPPHARSGQQVLRLSLLASIIAAREAERGRLQ